MAPALVSSAKARYNLAVEVEPGDLARDEGDAALGVDPLKPRQRTLASTEPRWREHGLVVASEVGTPISPRNPSFHSHEAQAAAGIAMKERPTPPAGVQRRHPKYHYHGTVRFHDFQYTAATNCAELGASDRIIAAIMGHEADTITARYSSHISVEALRP